MNGTRRAATRALEILAVLLLGVATLGSAWCGYQASRWNGEESRANTRASAGRVEASRLFGLATQAISYDSVIASQYAAAVANEQPGLAAFLEETLVREGFRPYLDEWRAQVQAGEPAISLVDNEAYIASLLGPYDEVNALAEQATLEGATAAGNADDFVLTTVLFASALFFAGVTTSFRARLAQIMLIVASGITLAYCASRLVELPIA